MIGPQAALARLLDQAGVGEAAPSIQLTGDDAPLPGPHRLATGMGVAIAAQAAAVNEIWRMRSGRRQQVSVNTQDAAYALNPAEHLRQNGYPVTIRFVFQEPGNGFFRAAGNRWIYMAHGSPRLRNGLLDVLQCANTKEAIARAVAQRDPRELEAECQQRGLPLVMVRTAAEWRDHAHGRLLVGRPVVEIERIGDGPPLPLPLAQRPLQGLRVLENTHILAGPGIGRAFAEQGADVLRIAPPRTSDPVNFMIDTGFGKRAAFLDLDAQADIARYQALAADADVVVQSLRPGALQRRGLGPRELAQASRGGLVYVSVSCYGLEDGPWSAHVGYDPLAQSATGISIEEGGSEAPRVVPSHLLADYLTAYLGAFGALAALVRRAREGGSWHVRISLAQTCMWVQDLGLRAGARTATRSAPPRLLRMDSPFGELEYLAPVARYSETPAFWDKPPVPLGASRAEWLPR